MTLLAYLFSLILQSLAFVGFIQILKSPQPKILWLTRAALLVVGCFHLFYFFKLTTSDFGVVQLWERLHALFGFGTLLACGLTWRAPLWLVTGSMLPIFIFGLTLFQFFIPNQVSMSLPSIWIWIHIVLMVMGEIFFFFGALIGAFYWMGNHFIRSGRAALFFKFFPSLPSLDNALGQILWFGYFLLTLGLMGGLCVAQNTWGPDWFQDPKIIFSVGLWCNYSLLLWMRIKIPTVKGKKSAKWALLGFFFVLFISWGGHRWINHSSPSVEELQLP